MSMIQRVDLELHIETAPVLKIHSPKLLVCQDSIVYACMVHVWITLSLNNVSIPFTLISL